MQNQIVGFRLSPQQKRIWLLQRDNEAYHAQCALLLEGNLEPEVLKEAVQQVVKRHKVLRTSFLCLAGMRYPVQVVNVIAAPSWQTIDLSGQSIQEQEAQIEATLQAEARQLINFEQPSLLRLCLLALSAQKHIL